MTDLTGKAALVTGASRGIGEAAARHLAKAGAAVTLAARSEGEIARIAAEIEGEGGRAQAVACDVADFAAVERAVAQTVDAFGSLDVVVNNAGVIEPVARLAESDPATWGHAFDINAKGVYHGLRAALPRMAAGTIVNISSGAAYNALEGWSHYCASKAAALMLTEAAEKESADAIRVVGLSPGTVATQMQREIKASGVNPVSRLEWDDHIPPDWPAKAIVWLCGAAGEDYRGIDCKLRDEDVRRAIGVA